MTQPRMFALFAPEVKALLERKAFKELRQVLQLVNAMDLAEGWDALSPEDRVIVFKLLSRRRGVVLFESLAVEDQASLLDALERDRAAFVHAHATPAAADVVQSSAPDGGAPVVAPPEPVSTLIRGLSPRTFATLSRFLSKEHAAHASMQIATWPAGTVGSVMHPPSVPLEPTLTARQALEKFQVSLRPGSPMPIAMLFVTGRDGTLLRAVELRDLLAAPPDVKLADLAASVEMIKLSPLADQEEAVRLFERYELAAAPVVDDAGRLIGIITTSDIIHVIREEASEDIAKMAGTSADELSHRTVFNVVRLRMPWLLVTVLGGGLVSVVIQSFEDTLRQLLALASFTPLIAAMGGNVGTQSSMIVVRGLATGELDEARFGPALWRECRAGMLLGLLYGTLAGGAAFALYGSTISAQFALVVGFAMFCSMSIASTLGVITPFTLKRLGTDPANATGPFITTATDLMTTVLYLSIATALLI